jgi:hypothetical protein
MNHIRRLFPLEVKEENMSEIKNKMTYFHTVGVCPLLEIIKRMLNLAFYLILRMNTSFY